MSRPVADYSKLQTPSLPEIPGCEIRECKDLKGYAISDCGDLYSCKIERRSCFGKWHQVTPSVDKFGRHRISVRQRSKRKTVLISQLVAESFLGKRPDGLFVLHKDGNPSNNEVANLYYGNQSQNMKDAVRHGTFGNFGKQTS